MHVRPRSGCKGALDYNSGSLLPRVYREWPHRNLVLSPASPMASVSCHAWLGILDRASTAPTCRRRTLGLLARPLCAEPLCGRHRGVFVRHCQLVLNVGLMSTNRTGAS